MIMPQSKLKEKLGWVIYTWKEARLYQAMWEHWEHGSTLIRSINRYPTSYLGWLKKRKKNKKKHIPQQFGVVFFLKKKKGLSGMILRGLCRTSASRNFYLDKPTSEKATPSDSCDLWRLWFFLFFGKKKTNMYYYYYVLCVRTLSRISYGIKFNETSS